MKTRPLGRLQNLFRRHRPTVQETSLLLAAMAFATWVAYEFDVFPNSPGVTPRQHVIELDEVLALATLLCFGLLVLCYRFLRLQQREVAQRIEAEHQARTLALQDALTGLPNRRCFEQELKAAIDAPPRLDGAHAVLLLDLNDFKRINDIYGHGAGDEVLVHVAMRLSRAVRDNDLVVRFGGDEFVVLARQLCGAEDATTIALRIIREFDSPVTVGAVRHRIGVGIGIALFPHDGRDCIEVMRKADLALYRAKAERKSAYRFFESEMDVRIRERDVIERELRDAIRSASVQPHYQPLIDLRSKRVLGFEALARWTHPALGVVPPDRFIPIAESCGLMSELTDHLLRAAVGVASQWPAGLTLAFNVSPSQLKDPTFGGRVLSILAAAGFSPRRLEIELTEAALVGDIYGVQEALGELRKAGVRIALDDFGTGYSNLYHLRNLKIDKIKIDRSFIGSMGNTSEALALVRALAGLGHGLGLTVTAEGVEYPEQASVLLAQGCEEAQGYLYGHAMNAADSLQFIAGQDAGLAEPLGQVA